MCGSVLYLVGAVIFVIFLLWFFLRADGDLTLLFSDKYGKSVAELKDRVIWITGASSGIGEALALELASVGSKLVLSGTSKERLENVRKQCLVSGPIREDDVLLLCFNMKNFSEHEIQFRKVLEHFGKLDILVNNAGRSQRSAFEDVEQVVDQELFEINTFGPVNLSRIVLRHFLERGGGHFVATSSTAGVFGVPFSASYTASKHALHGYYECLRSEKCSKGIDVTIVCPGPVTSRILENALTGKHGQVHGGKHSVSDRRMSTARCAHLLAVATVNKLDHAWITIQPVLLVHYLAQYAPTFFRTFVVRRIFSSELAMRMRDGSVNSLSKQSVSSK